MKGWVGLGGWLRKWDSLPARKQSPIPVLTGLDVEQLRWSRPTRYRYTKPPTKRARRQWIKMDAVENGEYSCCTIRYSLIKPLVTTEGNWTPRMQYTNTSRSYRLGGTRTKQKHKTQPMSIQRLPPYGNQSQKELLPAVRYRYRHRSSVPPRGPLGGLPSPSLTVAPDAPWGTCYVTVTAWRSTTNNRTAVEQRRIEVL